MVVGAVLLAQLSARRANGSIMSFRQGLRAGAVSSAVGSGNYVVNVYLYNGVVDDFLLVNVIANAREVMESRGLTPGPIEFNMAIQETHFSPAGFWVMVFVFLTLTGLIAAMIFRAFIRRAGRAAPSSHVVQELLRDHLLCMLG